MKYSSSNKPLVCMQTQSTCYQGTRTMTPVGVLWHSTGANNPTLKRYVQPSDTKPAEDTYTKTKWLDVLGKNPYANDWNHIYVEAGLNCWIGKLADGTVTTVQTMPWTYRPWGCGSGPNGSCNNGWVQFEICEDGLTDKNYFDKVYKEACEITAYICKLYNIDPNGTVTMNGIKVPTILCHADSCKLGLGSNHGDVNHWFPRHGKSMATARNDVAALLKGSGSSIQQPATQAPAAEVRTYKVVTALPTYANAGDAKAKTNAKGTYQPGTYYIYNKYPDGVNGMLNISKDSSGNSAGSWINPAENKEQIVEEVKKEETVQKLYRVRKSWADAKSQKGAFASLDNAKACCQAAGAGYKVFDWNGKEVYAYVAPVEQTPVEPPKAEPSTPSTPTEPAKAVYDLNYPKKYLIVDASASSTGIDKEKCTKAIVAITKNNSTFDPEIAKAFFSVAGKYRIDPRRAIAQSILETGWFKFAGSSVKPEQHNYCGLGATGGGVSGASFGTIEDGVRAQLQHLYAYGCKDALPAGETIIDPRFKYVTRGIATYWEQLAGRWAVPGFDGNDAEAAVKAGATYGQKIAKLYDSLLATTVTEADIKKYFPDGTSNTEKPDASNTSNSDEQLDVKKVNFVLGLLEKILTAILEFFNKK